MLTYKVKEHELLKCIGKIKLFHCFVHRLYADAHIISTHLNTPIVIPIKYEYFCEGEQKYILDDSFEEEITVYINEQPYILIFESGLAEIEFSSEETGEYVITTKLECVDNLDIKVVVTDEQA